MSSLDFLGFKPPSTNLKFLFCFLPHPSVSLPASLVGAGDVGWAISAKLGSLWGSGIGWPAADFSDCIDSPTQTRLLRFDAAPQGLLHAAFQISFYY